MILLSFPLIYDKIKKAVKKTAINSICIFFFGFIILTVLTKTIKFCSMKKYFNIVFTGYALLNLFIYITAFNIDYFFALSTNKMIMIFWIAVITAILATIV